MANVAVVAVHGVADQDPGSSARAIADLLVADARSYSSFVEVPLRIARKPLIPGQPDGDPGVQYMHRQVEKYRADDDSAAAVYETVRLEGQRTSPTPANVHVHEVYWADLSRAGSSWYRLLAEFYQLILHLPSLGRNALRAARDRDPSWKLAYSIQWAAVWLLTVPIPLLNLAMLSMGIVALSSHVGPPWQRLVIFAAAAAIGGIGAAFLTKRSKGPVRWLATPIVAAAAGIIAFAAIDGHFYKWVAAVAAITAAAVCSVISRQYARMKSGALLFGVLASGATAAVAIYLIARSGNTPLAVYEAAVGAALQVLPLLEIVWAFFFVLTTVAVPIGFATSKDVRGRRAAWTARFSLAFPSILFVVFTLPIWLLVIKGVSKMSPDPALAGRMQQALMDSSYGLILFVGGLALFIVVSLWVAAPSILYEIQNPKDHATSQPLGKWLTGGLRVVRASAEVLTLTIVGVLALLLAKMGGTTVPFLDATVISPELTGLILSLSAVLIAAMLTSKYLSGSFRAALDILLDVDNYMRESPAAATPRARIAERYVSLLRHLCQWRDGEGQGYGTIVIIAHSQGTVISADLLRYLQAVKDPELQPIYSGAMKVRLFTMGSPLKQLYSVAFPHLYEWVETPEGEGMIAPDPKLIGITQWINAYRTGDYVGRHLWLDERYARLWISKDRAADCEPPNTPTRVQICIGAGAHTHYWNANGSTIAAELNSLI